MLNAPVPGIDREQRLRQLMADHGSSVLQVSYLYLKDYPLAQDAAQTVFLKVWEALANPSAATRSALLSPAATPADAKAWLMRITVNTLKNILTSREFRLYAKATPLDRLPAPACADPLPDDTVLSAVLSLPEKYRAVVILHYYEGLPLKDAAEALHVPQTTVRTRLHRAKKLLHPMLKGWYFNE